MDWRARIQPEDVREAFRLILKREIGDEPYVAHLVDLRVTVNELIDQLVNSEEFAINHAKGKSAIRGDGYIPDIQYRSPIEFRRTADSPHKVIIVGPCLMDIWEIFLSGTPGAPEIMRATSNNASRLPPMTAEEAATFDFQICQLPLRGVMPDGVIFKLKQDDEEGHNQAFAHACDLVAMHLEATLEYNEQFGLTSFILNFALPQQSLLGRLAPRYSLANPVYFVERLNQHLASLVANRPGVHLVDFDQIVSTYGRRYFQDDVTVHASHGSLLGSIWMHADSARLEPGLSVDKLFHPRVAEITAAAYAEIVGLYRSIRQIDAIKIVIFDLDDTLWRGVAADTDASVAEMCEGWPLGMVEAASYLWKRGVVLAIVSKNDEDIAVRKWDELYGQIFPIDNFAVRKIKWESKANNISDIFTAVNLLPGNALFVDDNPVERAAVKAAFPEIRVMDASLATWRRCLLWSPELQSATFTREAGQRTEMLQRQIERDTERGGMDRAAFLASLDLEIASSTVREETDARYARCFELLNKTNQFNTTGRRWTPAEMTALLRAGGYFIALSAKDRFTNYGIVALALIQGNSIVQIVMSCRVFGMEVERALVSLAIRHAGESGETCVRGEIVDTDRNRLSRALYESCGFDRVGDNVWETMSSPGLPMPGHILSVALELS